MSKNIFFDGLPIFYINLDRSEDRNRIIIESFEKNMIKEYFRVSAVDGKKRNISFKNIGIKGLSRYEAAALESHALAMLDFLNTDYEYAAISEDDTNFDNSLKLKFNFYETLKIYNAEEYCLKLTNIVRDHQQKDVSYKISNTQMEYWGAGLYVINRGFAKKFLSAIYKDSILSPDINNPEIDYFINSFFPKSMTVMTVNLQESLINAGVIEKAILSSNEFINSYMKEDIHISDII